MTRSGNKPIAQICPGKCEDDFFLQVRKIVAPVGGVE
jgi:hypothetical protein